jgi:hypothetical protein
MFSVKIRNTPAIYEFLGLFEVRDIPIRIANWIRRVVKFDIDDFFIKD